MVLVCSTLFTTWCLGQNISIDALSDGKADSGYQTKWDSNHKQLLMYRDTSSPDLPAARLFHADGSSAPIYILRDFRDARFADVWAAASTREGGLVVSVILGFGERPDVKDKDKPLPALKSFLLTYDAQGALKMVWNVAPYHHEALAVDGAGEVFALGTRDAGKEGFPMLIKYSAEGKVLGEYLQSNTFAKGSHAIDGDALNGSPSLFVRSRQVFLWLPSTREAFIFSLNGELEQKIAIGRIVDKLAQKQGYVNGSVATLAASSTGEIEAEVRFWRETKSVKGAMLGLVVVSRDGSDARVAGALSPMSGNNHQFLGMGENDAPILLEHTEKGHAVLKRGE